MNPKKLNRTITGKQVEDAPKSIIQQGRDRFLSYKFEIMDDENIYSVSFEGKLTEEETQGILSAIRNCLYENAADAIQKHLEQNNLPYSGFVSTKKPLEHTIVMDFAELLLGSDTCGSLDRHIGDTNVFYAIADHQKWISENCCQGCYFATKRTLSKSENLYKYNIIGQTFNYNQATDDESGCFAIKKNRNDGLPDNIAMSSNGLVLPAFGCVDMIELLSNIDSMQTVEQVEKIAVK